MRLATLNNETLDGCPAIISADASRYLTIDHIARSMREILEAWDEAEPFLKEVDQRDRKSVV